MIANASSPTATAPMLSRYRSFAPPTKSIMKRIARTRKEVPRSGPARISPT